MKSCLTIQATAFILLRSPTPQTLFSRGRHLKTEEPYFVGRREWGFSLWVHNTYAIRQAADGTWQILDKLGNVVQHESLQRILPGGHVFNSHAHQWFGVAKEGFKPSPAQIEEWLKLIERVGRSENAVASFTGADQTIAHLAKVDGKWFVVHYYKANGVLATAYRPNSHQLAALFRALGW